MKTADFIRTMSDSELEQTFYLLVLPFIESESKEKKEEVRKEIREFLQSEAKK